MPRTVANFERVNRHKKSWIGPTTTRAPLPGGDLCRGGASRADGVPGNFVLEWVLTLQFVLLLFGYSSHQGFIISGPETLGAEQHHVTTNAALNSDKVLNDHLGVIKVTDIGRKIAH